MVDRNLRVLEAGAQVAGCRRRDGASQVEPARLAGEDLRIGAIELHAWNDARGQARATNPGTRADSTLDHDAGRNESAAGDAAAATTGD